MSAAFRRCRAGLLLVVLFSLAINLLMLTAPLYMLQVFDRVLTSRSADTLLYLTLVAGFAFCIFWGLDLVRGRLMLTIFGVAWGMVIFDERPLRLDLALSGGHACGPGPDHAAKARAGGGINPSPGLP